MRNVSLDVVDLACKGGTSVDTDLAGDGTLNEGRGKMVGGRGRRGDVDSAGEIDGAGVARVGGLSAGGYNEVGDGAGVRGYMPTADGSEAVGSGGDENSGGPRTGEGLGLVTDNKVGAADLGFGQGRRRPKQEKGKS